MELATIELRPNEKRIAELVLPNDQKLKVSCNVLGPKEDPRCFIALSVEDTPASDAHSQRREVLVSVCLEAMRQDKNIVHRIDFKKTCEILGLPYNP